MVESNMLRVVSEPQVKEHNRGVLHCNSLSVTLIGALVLATGFILAREMSVFKFSWGGSTDLIGTKQHQYESNTKADHNSMFEVIQSNLYQDASEPNNATDRKAYTLQGWERGTGGLNDSDRLLLGELYHNASSVFEYGLGESTLIAAHVGVPRYSGVDSDAEWVGKARTEAKMPHFRFYFADIGDTGSFGKPNNHKLKKIPFDYQIAPLVNEAEAFDVYLADGRYRVACACVSFLHALKNNGNMTKVRVAIHDYSREYYHGIESVAEVVRRSDALAVFKMKSDATEEDIYDVWEKHWWDQSR